MNAILKDINRLEIEAGRLQKMAGRLRGEMERHLEMTQAVKEASVWMNKTQAGRYMGVSYRTVLRYEKQGLVAFGERGRIHRDDLDRFMVNHRPGRARILGLNTKQGAL